jgi:LemA protein
MKASYIWIIVAVLVAITLFSTCSSYNGIVTKDETTKSKWGAVETQYQRRTDLITNLVNTVKGAANFEKSTLVEVTEARAKATAVQVDPTKLTPASIQQFQQAQGQLSSSLRRLLVVTENYPQLRATENFAGLQAQLEGTENRISVARKDFNDAVQDYNTSIRSFPVSIIARMNGYQEKGYFQSDPGAGKAPKVQF